MLAASIGVSIDVFACNDSRATEISRNVTYNDFAKPNRQISFNVEIDNTLTFMNLLSTLFCVDIDVDK
jgi:hypothetical protein